jgi:hypothetical protein
VRPNFSKIYCFLREKNSKTSVSSSSSSSQKNIKNTKRIYDDKARGGPAGCVPERVSSFDDDDDDDDD